MTVEEKGTGTKIILPLEMRWQPKEDITTYELAKCLPYLFRYNGTMPYEIDKSEPHFRHFEIIDHNSVSVASTTIGNITTNKLKENGETELTRCKNSLT